MRSKWPNLTVRQQLAPRFNLELRGRACKQNTNRRIRDTQRVGGLLRGLTYCQVCDDLPFAVRERVQSGDVGLVFAGDDVAFTTSLEAIKQGPTTTGQRPPAAQSLMTIRA